MSDENPTSDQGGQTLNSLPEMQRPEPLNSPKTTQPNAANEFQDVKKELSGYERSTLRWTIVIVAVNALTCLFIGLQWHEIKSGSSDTHTLAEQAKKQADKMSNMSDAADKIRAAAENMVIQDQRIADNAHTAMDASNKQSKVALDATISASKLDQRAWIGVGDFRVTQFEKDKSFKIDVEIKNSGKTPALDMTDGMRYGIEPSSIFGPRDEWFNMIVTTAEAIPPQGSHTMHMEIPLPVIAPFFDAIKAKTMSLYIVGVILYKTISKEDGRAEFCLVMVDPDKLDVAYCRTHNNMK